MEPEKESQPSAGTSAPEKGRKLTPGNADILENKSYPFLSTSRMLANNVTLKQEECRKTYKTKPERTI